MGRLFEPAPSRSARDIPLAQPGRCYAQIQGSGYGGLTKLKSLPEISPRSSVTQCPLLRARPLQQNPDLHEAAKRQLTRAPLCATDVREQRARTLPTVACACILASH